MKNTTTSTTPDKHPHHIFDNDTNHSRIAWRSLIGTIYQISDEVACSAHLISRLKDNGFRIDLQVDEDGRFMDICDHPKKLTIEEWRDLLAVLYLMRDSFSFCYKAIDILGKCGISLDDYYSDLYRHHAEDGDSDDGHLGTQDSE